MTKKFLADTGRCIGCSACEVACKIKNGTPEGVRRRRVVEVERGEYPNVTKKFVSMACFHCDDAPCVKVCPPRALYKRGDGIVLTDKEKCIGCGYCLYACPFGAPQFPGTGIFGSKGKMDKCTFCVEPYIQKRDANGSIIQGEPNPRCATLCPTKALLAGDPAEITKVKKERAASKLVSV